MKRALVFIASGAVCLALPAAAGAVTRNIAAGDVAGLYTAFSDFNATGQPNVIKLAAGTYQLNAGPLHATRASDTVTLVGAGVPIGTTGQAHPAPEARRYIIIGQNGQRVLQTETQLFVFGVTVTHNAGQTGGGILVGAQGWIDLHHSIVENNRDASGSGILAINHNNVQLFQSLIQNNVNTSYPAPSTPCGGGGIDATGGGELDIFNSSLIGNQGCQGGAVRVEGGDFTLRFSTVSGNAASGRGGGIVAMNNDDDARILGIGNSTITNNSAGTSTAATTRYGGGLVLDNFTPNSGIGGNILAGNQVINPPSSGQVGIDCSFVNQTGTWDLIPGVNLIGQIGNCAQLDDLASPLIGRNGNVVNPGIEALEYNDTVNGLPVPTHRPLTTGLAHNALSSSCNVRDQRGKFRQSVCAVGSTDFSCQNDGGLVSNSSFEGGTEGWFTFANNGVSPTMQVTADLARRGARSVRVSGRSAYWQGPVTSLTSLAAPGAVYDVSAWARVSGVASTTLQLTRKLVCAQSPTPQWAQIATVTATNSGWTQLRGALVMPPASKCTPTELSVYVEGVSSAPNPATIDILVDDFRVTQGDCQELEQIIVPTSDTGALFCANLIVANHYRFPVQAMEVVFNSSGSTLTSSSGASFIGTTGLIEVGVQNIAPGADRVATFCASRASVNDGSPFTTPGWAGLWGVETPQLAAQFFVTSEWAGGYCVDLMVGNPSSLEAQTWNVTANLNGSSTYTIWNINRTPSTGTGQIQLTPQASWAAVIPSGGTTHDLGFCANRTNNSGILPTVVSATGQ